MSHLQTPQKTTFNMHPDQIRACLSGNDRQHLVHFAAHEGMADVGAMLTQLPLLADVSPAEVLDLEREIRDASAEQSHQDLRAQGMFQHLIATDLDPRLKSIMDGFAVFDEHLQVSGAKAERKSVKRESAPEEASFTL